jgi:hypothetical protein
MTLRPQFNILSCRAVHRSSDQNIAEYSVAVGSENTYDYSLGGGDAYPSSW